MTKAQLETAARDRASHIRMWVTAGLALVADLASKTLAWRVLEDLPEPKIVVIPKFLDIRMVYNRGVAFGIELGWWPILLAVLAGIGLVVYLFLASVRTATWAHIGLGLILAGALGNLVDRLTHPYMVRDFIAFSFWPAFNLADVFLCIGVGLLALTMLRNPHPGKT